jgi:hypothetical protein
MKSCPALFDLPPGAKGPPKAYKLGFLNEY